MLTLAVKPIYPQSRDGTANAERIFQLQPNVFTMPAATSVHHSSSYIAPIKDPLSPRTDSTMDRGSALPMEPGTLIPAPVLREKAPLSTRSDTLRSRNETMSLASQHQLRMTEGSTVPSASWRVDNSVRESPMGVEAELRMSREQSLMSREQSAMVSREQSAMVSREQSAMVSREQSPMDGTLRSYDSRNSYDRTMSPESRQIKDGSFIHREIKRKDVKDVKVESAPVKSIYVSGCHSIVKRDAAFSRTQGLRLAPRFKHDYIEKLTLVL